METISESTDIASPTYPRKRKSSSTEASAAHPVKHRSSAACQSCRTRKVRCDVIRNDSTCTNCRLDGLQCVVLPSRRGKGNRNRNSIDDKIPSQDTQSPRIIDDLRSFAKQRGRQPDPSSIGPTNDAGQVQVVVTFDHDSDSVVSNQQPEVNHVARNSMDVDVTGAYDGLPTPATGPDAILRGIHERAALPAFVTPLPSRLLDEDVDYLVRKGATTVPEPELQAEILRGYLFSVHPFMPMLNSRLFVDAVLNGTGHHKISLLLFQAVMFAGLHSLPIHVISRLGFESTKQARKVFFDRVRLLYDFDVESDDAAVLQSLILMSTWYYTWQDRRQTWHWTGLAFDIARNMGLHREPIAKYASHHVQRFRRRLWWSLYIRDRLIALGTRRPMRIHDNDFDVAMLTLDDFDLGDATDSDQGRSLMPSFDETKSTALMCVQLARLCVCIGRVTSSQYTTLTRSPNIPHTMMILSRPDELGADEFERCDKTLDEWLAELEKNVQRDVASSQLNDQQSCSEVHWAMLNIAYLTTVNVLHRGRALRSLPAARDAQIARNSSRSKVKDAARRITKDSQIMLRHDQVRYFGLLGVTALIAASLSHLLDISSGDEDVRDASTFRLFQSLEVLQYLGSIYASADAAISFLASAARTAGITLPAQIACQQQDFSREQQERASLRNPVQTDIAVDTRLLEQTFHNSVDALPAELITLPNGGYISSWDQGVESSMGLFNYDFYSNAFGFPDGSLQDI